MSPGRGPNPTRFSTWSDRSHGREPHGRRHDGAAQQQARAQRRRSHSCHVLHFCPHRPARSLFPDRPFPVPCSLFPGSLSFRPLWHQSFNPPIMDGWRTSRSWASSTSGVEAGAAGRPGGPSPLRLERPGHPRADCRHDRQRQDRAGHRAHRRSGHRRRAGDRHRPERRPDEPAADLPVARRRRLRAVGERGRSASARAKRARRSPPIRPRAGKRGWPSGARTARASRGCARLPSSRFYTPGSTAGRPVSVLSSFARPATDDPELCASGCRRRCRACWRWPASRPSR